MDKFTESDFPEAFNGQFRPAISKIKCPKCRSKDLEITETMEAFTSFQVVDGRLNREGGIHEFGSWIGVSARCDRCDHHWKPRRAFMITDVVTELDPESFEALP